MHEINEVGVGERLFEKVDCAETGNPLDMPWHDANRLKIRSGFIACENFGRHRQFLLLGYLP